MGNDFCNQTGVGQQHHDQSVDQDEKDEKVQKIQNNKKVQPPSPYLAIRLDKLSQVQTSEKLTALQEKISKIMKQQKSNHLKLKISKAPIQQNRLPDPYLLLCNEQIYIGQWVYSHDQQTSVPGGIGRLYTNQQILEGQFSTNQSDKKYNPVDNQTQKYKQFDLTKKFIRTRQEKQFFGVIDDCPPDQNDQKLKTKNIRQEQKNYKDCKDNAIKVTITLEGEGRIFSREKQLSGTFKRNLLNGKGICKYKSNDTTYQYQGHFKDGMKHGKGLEKIGKLISYEGDFLNDKKQGSGVLILHLSQKYIKQRQKEENNILLQEKQADANSKIKITSEYINKVIQYENNLEQYLKAAGIDWKASYTTEKQNFKSFRQNQLFIIDNIMRTKFLQSYKGGFSDNQFSGIGTYTWFNGKCYQGNWKRGKMEGYGQFYWPDGTYYRGQYKDDLRHGKGEMIFSFEKRFRGTFAFGLKHGYGQLITVKLQKQPKNLPGQQIIQEVVKIRVKGSLYQNDKEIDDPAVNFDYYFDLDLDQVLQKLELNEKVKLKKLNLFDLKRKKHRTQLIIKNLLKVKKTKQQ